MVEKLKARFANPLIIAAFVCAVFIYSGFVKSPLTPPFYVPARMESVTSLCGTVASNASVVSSGKYYSVMLCADSATAAVSQTDIQLCARGKIKLLVPSKIAEAVYPGKLYSLSNKSVLLESGEKIACSGKWLSSSGMFLVKEAASLGHSPGLKGKILRFRSLCRLALKRLLFSWGDAGGLVLSLLSGSREYVNKSVGDDFKLAGLSHVLALSGMHLSFFAGLTGGSGRRVFGKRYLLFARLAGILFFVWFAGLSPSLFRALLCSLLTLLCSAVFCGTVDSLAVLGASFLVHTVAVPSDVHSAAFMLSYGALAGILLAADCLSCFVRWFLPVPIADSLSASVGAQTATIPVSISLFGMFMPVGIIASVAVTPAVSVFLTVSVAAVLLCLLMPFLSYPFGAIIRLIYAVICGIVRFFAMVPPVEIT